MELAEHNLDGENRRFRIPGTVIVPCTAFVRRTSANNISSMLDAILWCHAKFPGRDDLALLSANHPLTFQVPCGVSVTQERSLP